MSVIDHDFDSQTIEKRIDDILFIELQSTLQKIGMSFDAQTDILDKKGTLKYINKNKKHLKKMYQEYKSLNHEQKGFILKSPNYKFWIDNYDKNEKNKLKIKKFLQLIKKIYLFLIDIFYILVFLSILFTIILVLGAILSS